jgi:hypothetical protein
MKKKINVIGDVAGRYDELMLLLKKMPKADLTVFVGDLNDRGSQSKEVIEYVMNAPNTLCLQSNHGDMMVDFHDGIKLYHVEDFLRNGGTATCASYDVGLHNGDLRKIITEFRDKVPKEHIEWLRNLPYYYEDEHLFISHAAKDPTKSLEKVCTNSPESYRYNIIWNRGGPREMKGKLQVMGHNSHWGLKRFGTYDNPWAMCIDGSRKDMLTGLHVPTLGIYQEEYKD